eukprot:TRINITY_DN7013_c0_g1_i1.p1 TRINITY_DN7013_c0_g1~~TRINITY_DN7013_c0_g1_i1.p1  ORF type:complete len:1009 (+),score=268.57 TRINITY_DN7013_c0_g1_i1:223-3249(+)
MLRCLSKNKTWKRKRNGINHFAHHSSPLTTNCFRASGLRPYSSDKKKDAGKSVVSSKQLREYTRERLMNAKFKLKSGINPDMGKYTKLTEKDYASLLDNANKSKYFEGVQPQKTDILEPESIKIQSESDMDITEIDDKLDNIIARSESMKGDISDRINSILGETKGSDIQEEVDTRSKKIEEKVNIIKESAEDIQIVAPKTVDISEEIKESENELYKIHIDEDKRKENIEKLQKEFSISTRELRLKKEMDHKQYSEILREKYESPDTDPKDKFEEHVKELVLEKEDLIKQTPYVKEMMVGLGKWKRETPFNKVYRPENLYHRYMSKMKDSVIKAEATIKIIKDQYIEKFGEECEPYTTTKSYQKKRKIFIESLKSDDNDNIHQIKDILDRFEEEIQLKEKVIERDIISNFKERVLSTVIPLGRAMYDLYEKETWSSQLNVKLALMEVKIFDLESEIIYYQNRYKMGIKKPNIVFPHFTRKYQLDMDVWKKKMMEESQERQEKLRESIAKTKEDQANSIQTIEKNLADEIAILDQARIMDELIDESGPPSKSSSRMTEAMAVRMIENYLNIMDERMYLQGRVLESDLHHREGLRHKYHGNSGLFRLIVDFMKLPNFTGYKYNIPFTHYEKIRREKKKISKKTREWEVEYNNELLEKFDKERDEHNKEKNTLENEILFDIWRGPDFRKKVEEFNIGELPPELMKVTQKANRLQKERQKRDKGKKYITKENLDKLTKLRNITRRKKKKSFFKKETKVEKILDSSTGLILSEKSSGLGVQGSSGTKIKQFYKAFGQYLPQFTFNKVYDIIEKRVPNFNEEQMNAQYQFIMPYLVDLIFSNDVDALIEEQNTFNISDYLITKAKALKHQLEAKNQILHYERGEVVSEPTLSFADHIEEEDRIIIMFNMSVWITYNIQSINGEIIEGSEKQKYSSILLHLDLQPGATSFQILDCNLLLDQKSQELEKRTIGKEEAREMESMFYEEDEDELDGEDVNKEEKDSEHTEDEVDPNKK